MSNIYKDLENWDSYPQRLDNLRNQVIDFPGAYKIKELAEKGLLELLKIKQHIELRKRLDLLCVIKFKELEEIWSDFYQKYRDQYLERLDTLGIDSMLLFHHVNMDDLRNSRGLDFFEKLTQRWEDINMTREIYNQIFRKKR